MPNLDGEKRDVVCNQNSGGRFRIMVGDCGSRCDHKESEIVASERNPRLFLQ